MEHVGHVRKLLSLSIGVGAIMHKLTSDLRLSAASHQVLLTIEGVEPDDDGWRSISLREISEQTGRHNTTVRRCITHLIENGYLVVKAPERGWHRKYCYQVVEL